MFTTNNALDKVLAPIFGVWATQEGRDYFDTKPEQTGIPSSVGVTLPSVVIPRISIPTLSL